jgi:hypothetical protein
VPRAIALPAQHACASFNSSVFLLTRREPMLYSSGSAVSNGGWVTNSRPHCCVIRCIYCTENLANSYWDILKGSDNRTMRVIVIEHRSRWVSMIFKPGSKDILLMSHICKTYFLIECGEGYSQIHSTCGLHTRQTHGKSHMQTSLLQALKIYFSCCPLAGDIYC